MKNKLQQNYNRNRLKQTSSAPEQSKYFFAIWNSNNLLSALKWFYNYKKNVQHLPLPLLKVVFDLLGSLLVASGLTKFNVVASIAVLLMVSLGGTNGDN